MENLCHLLVLNKWRHSHQDFPETVRGKASVIKSDNPDIVGKEVYIQSNRELPFVWKGVPLRVIGVIKPFKKSNIICLNGLKSMTVEYSTKTLKSLLSAGVSVQPGDDLDNTMSEKGSPFISDALSTPVLTAEMDIDSMAEMLESGEDDAEKEYFATKNAPPGIAVIDADYVKNCAALASLQEVFLRAGLPYDFDRMALINDTLRYRASRLEINVTELILMAPWVIAQVDGFSMKEADVLAKHLGIKNTEARIYAEITQKAWGAAKKGESYIPSNILCAGVLNNTAKGTGMSAEDVIGLCTKYWKPADENAPRIKNPYGSSMGGVIPCAKFERDAVIADRLKVYEDAGLSMPKNGKYSSDAEYRNHRAEKDASAVYTSRVFFSERGAANALAEMAANPFSPLSIIPPARFENKNMGKAQLNAVSACMPNRIVVITGHAGSGKTFVLRALAKTFKDASEKVFILAPTGVAADRAASGIDDVPAGTIHRFSGITEIHNDLMVVEGKPEVEELSVLYGSKVLVDEMSMCDIVAFCALLNAVGPDGQIIMFIDPGQLPSIGPSGFMQQILRARPSGITICELDENYRQTNGGGANKILDLAEGIRDADDGKFTEKLLRLAQDKAITLDPDISVGHIIEKVKELKDAGASVEDIMVLCPKRIGNNGINALMDGLQKLWNPNGKSIASITAGTAYRVGDIVMNIRNDYADLHEDGKKRHARPWDKIRHPERKENIFNGYRGIIAGVEKETVAIQYRTQKGPVPALYTVGELRYWTELAYVLTVHKAQGGEAKHVILVLPHANDRALFYTAITRSKETLCLMGAVENFIKSAEKKPIPPFTKFVQRYNVYAGVGNAVPVDKPITRRLSI